jgi:hypothetical protein
MGQNLTQLGQNWAGCELKLWLYCCQDCTGLLAIVLLCMTLGAYLPRLQGTADEWTLPACGCCPFNPAPACSLQTYCCARLEGSNMPD